MKGSSESPYRPDPEIDVPVVEALIPIEEVLGPRVVCTVLRGTPVVEIRKTSYTLLIQVPIHLIQFILAGQEPVVICNTIFGNHQIKNPAASNGVLTP